MAQRTYIRTYLARVEEEVVVDDEDLTDEQVAILDDPRHTDMERDTVLTYGEIDYQDSYAVDDWQLTITRTDNPEED